MPRSKKVSLNLKYGNGSYWKRSDVVRNSKATYRGYYELDGVKTNFSAPTVEVLKEKIEAYEDEIRSGINQEYKDYTFKEFSDYWYEQHAQNSRNAKQGDGTLSTSTQRSYQRFLRYICEVIGQVKMQDLRDVHIEKIINKKGTGKSIIGYLYDIYIQVEKFAVLKKAFPQGRPSDTHIGRPIIPKQKEKPAFTEQEVKTVLKIAKETDEQLHVLVTTLFSTGIRINEALGLTWDDFDLDAEIPILTVRASLKRRKKKLGGDSYLEKRFEDYRGTTKNGKSREIELSAALVNLLKKYQRNQRSQRITSVVFSNAKGNWKAYHIWIGYWRNLMFECGLDPHEYTPHCTRHTYATISILNKEDIFTVSRRLGHASVQFTMDRYGHLQEGMQADAARAMDYLFATEKAG